MFAVLPVVGIVSVEVSYISQDRASGGTMVKVSSAMAHPQYRLFSYDVGIIKLQSPVAADYEIAFPSLAFEGSDPDAGTMATTAGW